MRKKQKMWMLIGAAALVIFMIGDLLLGATGKGGVEVGMMTNTNWLEMSMWRFELNMYLCAVCLPFFVIAMLQWIKISEEINGKESKLHKLFKVSNWAMIVSGFFVHCGLCLLPIIGKSIYEVYGDLNRALAITGHITGKFIVPLMIYVVIADAGVTIALWGMLFKNRLLLPKISLVCTPGFTCILLSLHNFIPSWVAHDIASCFESFGWSLMFFAGYFQVKKMEEKENAAVV